MIDNEKHGAFGRYGKAYQIVDKEKGHGGKLSLIGKLTYLCKWFEDITITEEDIKQLIPLESPTSTLSFRDGYNRASALIKNGFTENNYYDFLINFRFKEMIKIINTKRLTPNNDKKSR